MSELVDCINNLSAQDIVKSIAKTANGTPFYINTMGLSSGILPTDLSGLVLWLRGDLGITLNGSDVAYWADQGPAGYDFQQLTPANQPSYTVAGLDNNPIVTFIAANSESMNAVIGDLNESTWHIFGVLNNCQYALGRNVGNKDVWGNVDPSSISWRGDVAAYTFNYPILSGWHLCETTIDEVGAASNSWRDGVASVSNPLGAEACEFDALGKSRNGVAYANGSMAEIIIYDNIKTGDDLQALKDYIASRYISLTIS